MWTTILMVAISEAITEAKKLGFEIIFFIAGAAGALVSMRKPGKITIKEWVFNMISGGLVAVYLTPVVSAVIRINSSGVLFIAFVTGFTGYKSAEWAVEYVRNKLKKN